MGEIDWLGTDDVDAPEYAIKFLNDFYGHRSPSGIKMKDLSPISVGHDKDRKQYLLEIHRDIWLDSDEWEYVPEGKKIPEEDIVKLRDRVYAKMLEHFKRDIEGGRLNVFKDDAGPEFVSVIVHIYIEKGKNDGEHYGKEIMKILPEDW